MEQCPGNIQYPSTTSVNSLCFFLLSFLTLQIFIFISLFQLINMIFHLFALYCCCNYANVPNVRLIKRLCSILTLFFLHFFLTSCSNVQYALFYYPNVWKGKNQGSVSEAGLAPSRGAILRI